MRGWCEITDYMLKWNSSSEPLCWVSSTTNWQAAKTQLFRPSSSLNLCVGLVIVSPALPTEQQQPMTTEDFYISSKRVMKVEICLVAFILLSLNWPFFVFLFLSTNEVDIKSFYEAIKIWFESYAHHLNWILSLFQRVYIKNWRMTSFRPGRRWACSRSSQR